MQTQVQLEEKREAELATWLPTGTSAPALLSRVFSAWREAGGGDCIPQGSWERTSVLGQ